MKTKKKETIEIYIKEYTITRDSDCFDGISLGLNKEISIDVNHLSYEQFMRLVKDRVFTTKIKRDMTVDEIIKENKLDKSKVIETIKKHYENT